MNQLTSRYSDIEENLLSLLINNRLTRNEGLVRKLLGDFSPTLHRYIEELVIKKTQDLRVELHKMDVARKEILAQRDASEALIVALRRGMDAFFAHELRLRQQVGQLLDTGAPEVKLIIQDLEDTLTGDVPWPREAHT